jgi:hypothetical protein
MLLNDGGGSRVQTPRKGVPPLLARPEPKAEKRAEPREERTGTSALKPAFQSFLGGPPRREAPEPTVTPTPRKAEEFVPPKKDNPFINPIGRAPATAGQSPSQVKVESVWNMVTSVNEETAKPKDKVRTPKELLDTKEQRDLSGYMYDLNPKEWQRIQDNFNTGTEQNIEGTLTAVPPLLARPGLEPSVPKVKADEYSSAPLTWDAYQAMSGDQKAAVDFNTLLVEAREKDLAKDWTLSPEEMAEYDKRVTKVFGQGGKSTQLAPNTVKLLHSLDFEAVGQDLDQYLSLERGFSMEDLDKFTLDKDKVQQLIESDVGTQETQAQGSKTMADYAAVRTPENVAAIDADLVARSAKMIAEKMQQANYALANFDSAVINPLFDPTAAPGVAPLGYGDPSTRTSTYDQQMEDWMQRAYAELQSPTGKVDQVFGEMDEFQFTPEDRQQFLDYVNQRSLTENQYGLPEGSNTQLRSSDEIRKLVGIGG